MNTLELGNISVDVVKKDIKNLHLSVYPPTGRVRIAAPNRMDMDTIRVFAISKLSWIKQQQETLIDQARETPRDYIERESHYFMGKRYMLRVIEHKAKPRVEIDHNYIYLYIRPNTPHTKRKEVFEDWYRNELKKVVPQLITKWENKIGVKSREFGIKKMKTRWGTCKVEAKRIWLNLELARKPKICLEYIIVHELVHLLESTHNQRFVNFMDEFMPKWRFHREELNRLPFSHLDWKY